jgi:hypothetical protein
MKRALPVILGLLWLATAAGDALAAPSEPSTRSFSPADLQRAQEESIGSAGLPVEDFEIAPSTGTEPNATTDIRLVDDNDTAHYQRGRTLVIHIFINHTGGTWNTSQMDGAGARATVAKNHYINNAPFAANVSYDYQGSNSYWFYTATVPYFIGDSGMNGAVVEDVLANIGFGDGDGDGTRVDDMTFYLQNWGGGWDNVLACFEPMQTGRAWASYGYAMTYLYTNSDGNVFAHEWGHLYGACDEYVEGGQCNGGIDCGACQSWYLDHQVDNGNCQLAQCPSDVSCLMINNTFSNICPYTLDNWAWTDADNNGQLNLVKRHLAGNSYCNIYELWHNGWFYWNGVADGMVVSQRWSNWAVIGLRSPANADYDLTVYGDNNHNYPYASSAWGTGQIDFVVGDYNHNPVGNEHIGLIHYGGTFDWYNLTWEGGNEMLYPDGQNRAGYWNDYNVAQIWDVPLFAGETVTFNLGVGAGVNLGMALFQSYGAPYWAGRSSAVWQTDANGPGIGESYTYTVPADDVYGLVIFSTTAVSGSFDIQIGPTPYTLPEESPFYSSFPLRLFNYDPNSIYWAFVGTRPDGGTGVRLGLYDDDAYTGLLDSATDTGDGAMEFFAADYNGGYDRDYLRVIRDSGVGNHRSEWEQDPEIISGALPTDTWISPHLGKVWDAYLNAGDTYFLREYHDFSTPLDTGIYIFSSDDGNRFKSRVQYAAASNFRAPGAGGEWLSYTAPASRWYGIYQIVNDESAGQYSLWLGAKVDMPEAAVTSRSDEIVWGSANVPSIYWTVFAARPQPGETASVWLYGDDGYTINTLAASDQSANPVTYIVGDYNHNATGTVYPRYRRTGGYGNLACEWEGGSEVLVHVPGGISSADLVWPAGHVAEMYDIYVDGGGGGGRDVTVELTDLSGSMDFGTAFFASNGAPYYGNSLNAVARTDATGAGGVETLTVHLTASDWYGFVVYNKNELGGAYRIRVIDPVASSVESAEAVPFDLKTLSGNPFTGKASLEYSLDQGGATDLSIYDVQGRQVRSLVQGTAPAGHHTIDWDGRDDAGTPVASGIYFARLRSGTGETRVKLVRSQ